jgi:hypothetical protein
MLGRLLAHDPADGIDYVRLAAAIWTNDPGNGIFKSQNGPVNERLEAADFETSYPHPGTTR